MERLVDQIVSSSYARRASWYRFDKRSRWRRLLRVMDVALLRPARVNKVLANLVGNLAEIDEAVTDVDQLWRSVGSESGNLDATTFVGDGVDGIDEVFVTRNQHRGLVATGQRKHVDGDLNIDV